MVMIGHYDAGLVALSIAVAILASFTSLNLAGRLLAVDASARPWWLLAASIALGGGIWSMHFVGMLAFVMPVSVSYDVDLTLLSLALPIIVVGAALYTLSRMGRGWRPLLAAGLLSGLGIATMHYTGMAAMRMPGVRTDYDPSLVAASIAIAILAATGALWLAFRTESLRERMAAAAVMGTAISGMHYTAMAAATFTMMDQVAHPPRVSIESDMIAAAVVAVSSLLLLVGLIAAFFDRKLATLTAREAEALRQSEERHRALISNASDIVAILDRDLRFVYEGSSAGPILGYGTDELIGRPLPEFVRSDQQSDCRRFLASLSQRPGQTAMYEVCVRHADGSWRDFEIAAKDLHHEPAIGGLVVNLRDISERKRLISELEKLSETDALTGTLNRRGFFKLAERENERLTGARRAHTLVMIDIDHFKEVNDTFGHAAGDMVLARIADQCRRHIRGSDVVARFGGEEFLLLLAETPPEHAHAVTGRLRKAIETERVTTIKGEIWVTASFGIAAIDAEGPDLETAIRLADEALYEAKNAGRNCIKMRA